MPILPPTPALVALALLATAPLALLALQDPPPAPDPEPPAPAAPDAAQPPEPERYPPRAPESVLRFFALEGEPDYARLREAIAKLDGVSIAFGPSADAARPGSLFVALAAPPDAEPKKLAKALERARVDVEELAWVLTRMRLPQLPDFGGGNEPRDRARSYVLGVHGDMRWFASDGTYATFFFVPGKIDGPEIVERVRQGVGGWVQDFDVQLVRDTFTWRVAGPASKAERVEKALAKIPGVASATIGPVLDAGLDPPVDLPLDQEPGTLTVELACHDLAASGPLPAAAEEGDDAARALRPCFDTTPVFEALAKLDFQVLDEPTGSR